MPVKIISYQYIGGMEDELRKKQEVEVNEAIAGFRSYDFVNVSWLQSATMMKTPYTDRPLVVLTAVIVAGK